MTISVNWATQPYLITIPQSDLTLIGGTRYSITVNYLWELLRNFSDSAEGSPFPVTYRRTAATASTPAITEINDPAYAAQFEDGAYSVDILNGNTNFRDVEVKNSVSVGTNNTTGFIDPTFLEAALFNGMVSIDVDNGVPGTGKTGAGAIIGTVRTPSSNTADALSIAVTQGVDTFGVKGDLTIDSGLDYTDYVFVGQGPNLSIFTITDAAVVNNITLMNAEVTGTLDGASHIEDCIINGLDYVSGVIERCILEDATITLGGSETAHLIDCASGVPGGTTPVIDMGGGGQALAMRNYNGGITLTNKTGAEAVSIDLNAGQIRLTNTVSNGTIIARGVGKLVDDATGDRIPSGTWNGATIVNELIDEKQMQEVWHRLDLDPIDPNTYADDGSSIANTDFALTKSDNGDGTFDIDRT